MKNLILIFIIITIFGCNDSSSSSSSSSEEKDSPIFIGKKVSFGSQEGIVKRSVGRSWEVELSGGELVWWGKTRVTMSSNQDQDIVTVEESVKEKESVKVAKSGREVSNGKDHGSYSCRCVDCKKKKRWEYICPWCGTKISWREASKRVICYECDKTIPGLHYSPGGVYRWKYSIDCMHCREKISWTGYYPTVYCYKCKRYMKVYYDRTHDRYN